MGNGRVVMGCVALMVGAQSASAETLRVSVSDRMDGAPVRAVAIAVGKPGTLVTARTDAAGTASLTLPETQHVSVVIRSDTHGFRCFGPEQVASGILNVQMARAVRVHGVVTGADGKLLPNAMVKVEYGALDRCRVRFATLAEEQVTNAQGEFTLRHIDASQDFQILVAHTEHKPLAVGKAEALAVPLTEGVRSLNLLMRK